MNIKLNEENIRPTDEFCAFKDILKTDGIYRCVNENSLLFGVKSWSGNRYFIITDGEPMILCEKWCSPFKGHNGRDWLQFNGANHD